jgi:hypothetical protein
MILEKFHKIRDTPVRNHNENLCNPTYWLIIITTITTSLLLALQGSGVFKQAFLCDVILPIWQPFRHNIPFLSLPRVAYDLVKYGKNFNSPHFYILPISETFEFSLPLVNDAPFLGEWLVRLVSTERSVTTGTYRQAEGFGQPVRDTAPQYAPEGDTRHKTRSNTRHSKVTCSNSEIGTLQPSGRAPHRRYTVLLPEDGQTVSLRNIVCRSQALPMTTLHHFQGQTVGQLVI